MQVGDVIIFVGRKNTAFFTINKHYVVYKVRQDFVPGHTCGWVIDDSGESVYFRDDENDNSWKYVKIQEIRKEKINKLNEQFS